MHFTTLVYSLHCLIVTPCITVTNISLTLWMLYNTILNIIYRKSIRHKYLHSLPFFDELVIAFDYYFVWKYNITIIDSDCLPLTCQMRFRIIMECRTRAKLDASSLSRVHVVPRSRAIALTNLLWNRLPQRLCMVEVGETNFKIILLKNDTER